MTSSEARVHEMRALPASPFPLTYQTERESKSDRAWQSGFTLIEIMVVTVILGIALALTVANLQPDDRQAAQREGHALILTLQTLQDRAVLGGRALALSFTDQGATIWERDERGDWQESRQQDEGARKSVLTVEALKLGATPAEAGARIVFLPEGVGMPFELTVSLRGHPVLISGDALGNMTLKQEAS